MLTSLICPGSRYVMYEWNHADSFAMGTNATQFEKDESFNREVE